LEAVPEDPFPGILLFIEQMPALFYSINGIVLLALLLLSGLISGSEVAFFSLSPHEIEEFRDDKNRKLNIIARLLENPKKLLATILILNNFINIAIITLSTFLSWQIVGSKSPRGMVIVILTFLVTFAIVFIGEVVPKVYANQNNLTFARITAPLLNFSQSILHPLSWLLMSISHVIEKRVERKGYNISVDELNQALEITTGEETKGIVNFGTLTVTQVMRSRLDITAFDMEIDFHDLMDTVNKTGYSRIPVFNETIDKIEGILYIKDLLPYLDSDEQFAWQKLLRPGYFVPESKKIDALLKDFQEKRVHMAIIVDEYGGTSGLITLEDIIEEIVGEIKDEFDDDDDVAYHMIDNNTYVFEGKTSLNDFCKIVGEDVSIFEDVKGESESLGGLILEIHSKLPRVGEKINFDRFVFTVVSVDTKRIKRVRVFINEPSQQKSANT